MGFKKGFFVCAGCILLLALLCLGCGGEKSPDASREGGQRVVCLGFPEYDWARSILGENPAGIELSLIVDNGSDPHSYQATVQDIAEIGSCDLLIHTGGVSDQWVSEALESGHRDGLVELSLLRILSDRVVKEEQVEGMTPEDKDEHEHEHADASEADEHVWLSLANASLVCDAICSQLEALDSQNAALYRANCDAYREKLLALDRDFAAFAADAPCHTILVADRFPFRYLVEDYDLDYYAAFPGCSSESNASFETVLFLSKRLSEEKLPAVLVLDGSSQSIAGAVLDNSMGSEGKAILTLDSLQSVTAEQIREGKSYLSTMEQNLSVLRQALAGDAR